MTTDENAVVLLRDEDGALYAISRERLQAFRVPDGVQSALVGAPDDAEVSGYSVNLGLPIHTFSWGVLQGGLGAVEMLAMKGNPKKSDRNAMEHFAAVDVQDVLRRVATLDIQTWNYKGQAPGVRHLGPMAQDFAAAFGLGADDRFIDLVDGQGVAVAAIQALAQRVESLTARVTELEHAPLPAVAR